MAKEFTMATGNFTAAGGDGYIMLKNLQADKKYDTAITIPEVLEEYVRKHSSIQLELEDRITIIGS